MVGPRAPVPAWDLLGPMPRAQTSLSAGHSFLMSHVGDGNTTRFVLSCAVALDVFTEMPPIKGRFMISCSFDSISAYHNY